MIDQEINETNRNIHYWEGKEGRNEGKKRVCVCVFQNASNCVIQQGSHFHKFILNKKILHGKW